MHHKPSPLSRWSREHWMLAGLCASLGTLVLTIIPGFASAMREPARHENTTTLSLPLPALAGKADFNAQRRIVCQTEALADQFLPDRGYGLRHARPTLPGTDVTANVEGFISVTPLRCDLTAHDRLRELEARLA